MKENPRTTGPWWQKVDFIIIHLCMVGAVFAISRQLGLMDIYPLNEKLDQWDTGWYNDIRINGYSYSDQAQSNSGFFPLFPYLWKWSGFDVFGIAIFNVAVSLFAFIMLFKNFHFKKWEFLIAISFPSVFFLFIPYTESLFFLFSSIFLVGLKKKSTALIWTGLFLASATRSTGMFFLPAIGFMLLADSKNNNLLSWQTLKKLLFYVFPIFAGVAVVVVWQYLETGVWFAYFKAQSNHWFRNLSLPVLPLTTWNDTKVLWLDALAFLFGFAALVFVVTRIVHRILNKRTIRLEVLFSEGYLCAVFLSLLLFGPRHEYNGLTVISGANRYIFVSPFFFLLLKNLLHIKFRKPQRLYLFIPLFWLLFNIYNLESTLIFALLTVYVFLFIIVSKSEFRSLVSVLIYLINLVLQFYILDLFLRGEWVG